MWQLIWVQRGHHYSSEMHGHHILFTDKARLTTRSRGQIWGGRYLLVVHKLGQLRLKVKLMISEYIFSLQRGFCNILWCIIDPWVDFASGFNYGPCALIMDLVLTCVVCVSGLCQHCWPAGHTAHQHCQLQGGPHVKKKSLLVQHVINLVLWIRCWLLFVCVSLDACMCARLFPAF